MQHLNHGVYVALGPRELRGVLDSDKDDEVQIVPHVVLLLAVLLERHRLVVKRRPLQTYTHTHTQTHTHPFNGPLSGTTQVSRYQKGKTNQDFTGARQ